MEENDEEKNYGTANDTLGRGKMEISDDSFEYVQNSDIFLREEEKTPSQNLAKNMNRRTSGTPSPLIVSNNESGYFVISLDNFYKKIFDFIIILLVAYSCFSSIFYVAFEGPSSTGEIALMIVGECLFAIDILLNFLQEFNDPTTYELVRNHSAIAKNYLFSYFFLDFIAILPLQIIGSNYYALKLFRVVRLSKLMSFVDSSQFSEILKSCFTGSTKDEQVEAQYFVLYMYKIFRLLLLDLIITYFLAMTMYIVSNELNYSSTDKTFLGVYGFKSLSTYEQVVRCMYFIMTTLTTVGYGDYFPYSTVERIYIIFVELIGVSFYSYIMGNFIEIISNYEKKVGVVDKSSELENWITYLTRFNSNKPLDKDLLDEIEEHFKYFWREYRLSSIGPDDPYLNCLPKFTRYNIVIHHLFSEIFYDFRHFFSEGKTYSRFLYDMAFGFLPRIFTAGREIFHEDEDVEELYVIRKGIVSVGFSLKGERNPAISLRSKYVFGDFYIFSNKKSEFFYEAKTDAEMIGITKEHFLSVFEKYPKKKEKIQNDSIDRYRKEIKDPIVEFRSKILKKYNAINAYEELEIKDKATKKVQEPNKKEIQSAEAVDLEAGKDIEETLDSMNNELKEYNTKILNFTEKYLEAFELLNKYSNQKAFH